MPMALTSFFYSYSIMLLIHQGHQSKVKVVAKAKSTGLYSLGLWGILPQKILAKYTATFSPSVTKFASSSLKVCLIPVKKAHISMHWLYLLYWL